MLRFCFYCGRGLGTKDFAGSLVTNLKHQSRNLKLKKRGQVAQMVSCRFQFSSNTKKPQWGEVTWPFI